MTVKLDGSGRTVLRANYGRFNQGALTGELEPIHPGVSPITTMAYNPATQDYTRFVSTVHPKKISISIATRGRPTPTSTH